MSSGPIDLIELYLKMPSDMLALMGAIVVTEELDNERVGYFVGIPLLGMGSLFVEEKYRGLGYGSKLLDAYIKEARNRNFKVIRFEVHKDNLIALNLYKSRGFVCRSDKDIVEGNLWCEKKLFSEHR